MVKPLLADKYHCTGCLACADNCPVGAISLVYDSDCCMTYHINNDVCIHCGLCEKTCPVISGFQYGENCIKKSQLYAGWCSNSELREKSSSGGIYAALAKAVIEEGGVAIGASLSGYTINHIAVDNVMDICKLQGSKYAQSVTLGIFKKTRKLLKMRGGQESLVFWTCLPGCGAIEFLGREI